MGTYNEYSSKPTTSIALNEAEKNGYIFFDRLDHRRFKLTETGEKYLKKSELADLILSSNFLESHFSWNPETKSQNQ